MSTRRHKHDDDTSCHHPDVALAPVSYRPTGAMGSPAIATREPSSSARGTTYLTSDIRDENTPSRSLSEPQALHDAQERADVERNSSEYQKRSATSTDDQGSMYLREGEETRTKDEVWKESSLRGKERILNTSLQSQSRPLKEEDQHRYDEDRSDVRRDDPRGTHYASLKKNVQVDERSPLAHGEDVELSAPTSARFQYHHEAQSRELKALQHKCQAALEEKEEQADAFASLKQQYDEQSERLSAVRHERREAREQWKLFYDAHVALRHQYKGLMKDFDAARHKRQAVLEQKQKAEEECTALRQMNEVQKNEYNALSNKYQSLQATLEQRTSELQGVQKFLTTADTFSGSEVVNTLRKLNEEVQQSTTFMAEWMAEKLTFETPLTDQTTTQTIEQTRSSSAVGTRLMQLLGTRKHKDNPILVEMAFRAYLIYELHWIASPWGIGEAEQSHNTYIDAIYRRMRKAEGQAISGNWRALTRAYTVPACIDDPELARVIDTTIITGLSDILLAAGCTSSKSDITSALWSKFAEKIRHFVSLAGQINKIIGVGVISEDFEVVAVMPDVVFDEKVMEDSYDNGDRMQGTEEHQETVLCATELGLRQRMIVGAGAGEGIPSELIVTKPKVALVSVIDIIDE